MEFDEEELNYLRNAADLFDAHIKETTRGKRYARRTILLGEHILAKLWAYEPKTGGENAEDADGDDRRP